MSTGGEAVASIVAGCARCDWGASGREAVALKLFVDGVYSQHLLLTQGERPSEYRVMLGSLSTGQHRLTLERDTARSSRDTGAVSFGAITVRTFGPGAPEYAWLSRAPILHARPGTVERFSDVPLVMYVEATPNQTNSYRYTVIFTNEDGGTPTDRLMATWGRTTDIEYVYGVGPGATSDPARNEEIQAKEHELLPFKGPRAGTHPLLWVSTDNNMVSDTGPTDVVRFAPAPQLVSLDNTSREAVMDKNPWMYAVMSAEIAREGRIDAAAAAGSGKIPDPRRFAYLEGCADVTDATLAFDIGLRAAASAISWNATDRGDTRFRIARAGCFRAAVPLPVGAAPTQIAAIRVRAYTRPARQGEPALAPGSGRVVLQRINTVFMLDNAYRPMPSGLRWTGALDVKPESAAVDVPVTTGADRE